MSDLQPLQSWSHPFKDRGHSLSQLTRLACATGGYYTLGRNGFWHGGVHFDGNTAQVFDQSSVHCLADGEVVAYRIDTHSPATMYATAPGVLKPFSRNFVLVRHHLQAPRISDCTDTPPSLIFYSLYMHLQDSADYHAESSLPRPAFWLGVHDRIVVLKQPMAIKAGELIGHIGLYQDGLATVPDRRLHLEVISGDGVSDFLTASRAWAQRLAPTQKAWLKLVRNTPVVPHQAHYSARHPPLATPTTPRSATHLLIPKNLLDSLPDDRKITLPATRLNGACHWYRLDGLLNDANNQLLDGWIREDVGVTPWFSPWAWEGYELIFSHDTPLGALASQLRALEQLDPMQLQRFARQADEGDKSRVLSRLHDLIDRTHDGRLTTDELQAALHVPAHAQSISQLIVHCESEWYKPHRWNILDEILGHISSDPHVNWLAEKARIMALSWWGDVAHNVGLPQSGRVHHFHALGLLANFASFNPPRITPAQLKLIFPEADEDDIATVLTEINDRLVEFKLDTRLRQRHFFAQIKGEVGASMKGVTERWEYSPETLKAFSRYYRAHPHEAEADGYLKDSRGRIIRMANQRQIGLKHFQRLNGNRPLHPTDGFKFRGRGLIQITGYEKYNNFMIDHDRYWQGDGPDTIENPDIINEMPMAIRSAVWFWLTYKVFSADNGNGRADVQRMTQRVNGGQMGLEEREAAYRLIERVLT